MPRAATADVVVRSREKGSKAYRNVQEKLDRLNRRLKTFGALAGGAAVAGVTALTVKSFESVDALAKQAEKIGESTTNLGALNWQAVQAGGSVGGMQEALVKATKRLGEFNSTGGGAAGVWLKRLNLDTKELAELSPSELFGAYSEAIGGLNSRGEKLAAISALMGDESRALIGLVDQGAEGFAAAQEEVERYGIALNGVDSAKIERANDLVFQVKERFKGVGNVLAAKVAPIVTAIANRFLDSGTEASEMGNIVDRVMDGIALGVGLVADALFGWKIIFAGIRIGSLQFGESLVGVLAKVERATIIVGNKMADVFGGEQNDVRAGFLTRVEESLAASGEHARMVAAELANSERPSQALARALETARTEAEQTAIATEKARDKLKAITGPTFEDNTKDEQARKRAEVAEQKFRDQLARKIEILEQSFLDEEGREIAAFERRQEIIDNAFESTIISKDRADALTRQLEEAHQEKLNKITLKGLTARQKFEQKSGKARAKQVFADLENITAGVANNNKVLFRINQAAAIANAIISTHQGVAKTLATYPWPLAGILAAAHLAAGIAQISAIRSASFGGGTTPSLAGSTPTFNDQPVQTPDNQDGVGTQEPEGRITIIVQGSLIGDDGIREIIGGTLQDLIDLDEIIISPESRQAQVIRDGSGSGG